MDNQNFDKTLIKQEEKNSCWNYIFIIIKCLLTLSIWGNMTWLIIITKEDKNTDPLIPILDMIFSYVLYFIFEICSPTLSLLCSAIADKDYEKVISDFMQAAPDINFTCFDEIYNGHKKASHKFPYKFCTDNSEYSILNEEDKKRKCLVKLIINREIFYNDDETRDAFRQKEKEYSQEIESGKRWVDISFFGLKNICLISLKSNCLSSSCSILVLVYIIFIFLSFGEIYELILYCTTMRKTITIKKIITIKDEFKISARIANAFQNSSETNQNNKNSNEDEIILYNSGNKLKLRSSTRNNRTSSNDQSENESNRIPENENIIISKFSNKTLEEKK